MVTISEGTEGVKQGSTPTSFCVFRFLFSFSFSFPASFSFLCFSFSLDWEGEWGDEEVTSAMEGSTKDLENAFLRVIEFRENFAENLPLDLELSASAVEGGAVECGEN